MFNHINLRAVVADAGALYAHDVYIPFAEGRPPQEYIGGFNGDELAKPSSRVITILKRPRGMDEIDLSESRE